mmetsp:Transcript_21533/g.40388  ORF Transcript_21533/g.40388 Transcript_21533/m.40388 type:complete len:457 (-) Transcript_21533:232-1602(-)
MISLVRARLCACVCACVCVFCCFSYRGNGEKGTGQQQQCLQDDSASIQQQSQAQGLQAHYDVQSLGAHHGDISTLSQTFPEGICPGGERKGCEVLKVLGKGTTGSATLEDCSHDGKPPVVKKDVALHGDYAFRPQELDPMILGLPFIMPVQDVYHTEDTVFLFMPHFNGGDFAYLDTEPEKPPQGRSELTKHQAAMIALGLFNLHRSGFVHRDFKGANLMRHTPDASTDIVAIIDFGCVANFPVKNETRQVGTGIYKAPERDEIYRGGPSQEYGPEADWYAFGLMLFHAHAKRQIIQYGEYEFTEDDEKEGVRKWLSSKGRDVIKKAMPGGDKPSEADQKLLDLILLLVTGPDGDYERNKKVPWQEESMHPVLTHGYWTSDPAIDWSAIEKQWRPYESGLCTSPIRVVQQTNLKQGEWTGNDKVTQETCKKLVGVDWARPCRCREGSGIEHCCCKT